MNNLNKVIFCTENCFKLQSVVSSNPVVRVNFLCNKPWVRFIVSPKSHWLLDNSTSMKLLYTWLKQIFNLFFFAQYPLFYGQFVGRYLKLYYFEIRHNNLDIQNSRVRRSSHKIELHNMTGLRKTFKFHFELLTRKLNFYLSTFKLLLVILL